MPAATTSQPPSILLIQGINHLDLSTSAMGNVVLVYDQKTSAVHLFGNFSPGGVQFMGEVEGLGEDKVVERLMSAGEDFREYLTDTFGGHRHIYINYRDKIPNGIPVGGGRAFYNGSKLYFGDSSGDFGEMTEVALRKCLSADQVEIYFGKYILREGEIFCEKGWGG